MKVALWIHLASTNQTHTAFANEMVQFKSPLFAITFLLLLSNLVQLDIGLQHTALRVQYAFDWRPIIGPTRCDSVNLCLID